MLSYIDLHLQVYIKVKLTFPNIKARCSTSVMQMLKKATNAIHCHAVESWGNAYKSKSSTGEPKVIKPNLDILKKPPICQCIFGDDTRR